MNVSVIIACAGKGERAGLGKNKLFYEWDGMPCFVHTLNAFLESGLVNQIILTASEEDLNFIKEKVDGKATVVKGGLTRTDSVKNALKKVTGTIVLIHDGARPFVSKRVIEDCINAVKNHGGAIPVVPCRDTTVKADDQTVTEYLGKSGLYSVQTPQGFFTQSIRYAYTCAGDRVFNDDGEVYKEFVGKLATFDGDQQNVKLTFPQDFKSPTPEYRFGTGFDCHKLVEGRKLILGGVEIPHDKGLLGHSDADVLAHAIMDALLSSLAMRDIGYHFSDKDPAYKDANSMDLLQKVLKMIDQKGYKPHNISATIMAEKPKLLKIIPTVTENLAQALSLPIDSVGIGATTLEGLGFVGREEGICVHATATVIQK
ncbi:MAG: 2-C-methyl-D-erythritol 2,4-cyclodiphosphate synthase [Clostridia bacterium]|nr:2-C-methyl-D-erythritol 2,4-cyclodiphosphate synthase [Clostridia bacterium]